MRAFNDIAGTTEHRDIRVKLLDRARGVLAGCADRLPKEDLAKLQQRVALLEQAVDWTQALAAV
jgi:hypothetical protein